MKVFHSIFCFFVTFIFTQFECAYSFEAYNQYSQLGGSLMVPGTNPYQVAILRRLDFNFDVLDGLKFVCGGSLISPQWVLTSAQCVEYPNLKIKLGVNNIRQYERFHVHFDITKDNIKVHPKYIKGVFENDIALIKLPRKVQMNQYIQPIALPLENSETYVNETAFISGWSRVNPFTPVTDFLRQATVKVLDNEICQANYKSPLVYITCNHMCTSGGAGEWLSEISCLELGDAGAPLIYFNSKLSRPEQVGIAIRSPYDCKGKPMLYTKIGPYQKWINHTLFCGTAAQDNNVTKWENEAREVQVEKIGSEGKTGVENVGGKTNVYVDVYLPKSNESVLGVKDNVETYSTKGSEDIPGQGPQDLAHDKADFQPERREREVEVGDELYAKSEPL